MFGAAFRYVQNFKKLREELTQKLFKVYNEKVFDGQVSFAFSCLEQLNNFTRDSHLIHRNYSCQPIW